MVLTRKLLIVNYSRIFAKFCTIPQTYFGVSDLGPRRIEAECLVLLDG